MRVESKISMMVPITSGMSFCKWKCRRNINHVVFDVALLAMLQFDLESIFFNFSLQIFFMRQGRLSYDLAI
jgi:hypothetical protein